MKLRITRFVIKTPFLEAHIEVGGRRRKIRRSKTSRSHKRKRRRSR